jgi:hypothetical protein
MHIVKLPAAPCNSVAIEGSRRAACGSKVSSIVVIETAAPSAGTSAESG